MDKYQELRDALATEPTDGPWRQGTRGPNGHPVIGAGSLLIAMLAHSANEPDNKQVAEANAAYITAANPEIIRALLAERDELLNEKRWIEQQPDDDEKLYEQIMLDARRSFRHYNNTPHGTTIMRSDSFDHHVMLATLHHAELKYKAERDELLKDKERLDYVIRQEYDFSGLSNTEVTGLFDHAREAMDDAIAAENKHE